jgi:g-D-glutamyl-meso-diaminopimelate peptidase
MVSLKKLFAVVVLILVLIIGCIVFWGLNSKPKPTSEPVKTAEIPSFENYKVIGLSVDGRKIEAYTFGNGTKHIVFVGGIHGGYEWNSVLLAYNFIDYLKENHNAVPTDLSVTVIPDANPDGVFEVTGKEGRFTANDISKDQQVLAKGRFNANDVDLNRNFDCDWQPKGTWQSKTTSAGTAPFSEPEAEAIRDYALTNKPDAFVFWHSQSGSVYASQCGKGILPKTTDIMNAYSKASGYSASKVFGSYSVTGAAEDWLSTQNIPAITVEFNTHNSIEWDKNLAGIKALFAYFSKK